MAFTSMFKDRFEQVDRVRNQRLSLLQAEKEQQLKKSHALVEKYNSNRELEQRCLLLEQKIALQNLKVSVLKSEIGDSSVQRRSHLQKLMNLRSEIDNIAELERSNNSFYNAKVSEMNEFRGAARKFLEGCRVQVEVLKSHEEELRLRLKKFEECNDWYINDSVNVS